MREFLNENERNSNDLNPNMASNVRPDYQAFLQQTTDTAYSPIIANLRRAFSKLLALLLIMPEININA